MRKILAIIFILLSIILALWLSKVFNPKGQKQEYKSMNNLSGKKAVVVVASEGFKDEEFFPVKEILEKAGAEIVVASDQKGMAVGSSGKKTEAQLLLSEVKPEEFDAVVFIGGPGALEHLDNEESYRIAKETSESGKILGAICISPVILAKAGVLKNKKATVWTSNFDKEPAEILEQNGALYQKQPVVQDDKIITANGPSSAKEFGEAITKAL